jgi:vacuolar-type H+-ATPase subunit F/Vma7
MKAVLHAIGRSRDILPYAAAGFSLHEVSSIDEARSAVEACAAGSLVILSEEFAEAAEAAEAAEGPLVVILPGVQESKHAALQKTRDLITRSIGVDLIAKAQEAGSR